MLHAALAKIILIAGMSSACAGPCDLAPASGQRWPPLANPGADAAAKSVGADIAGVSATRTPPAAIEFDGYLRLHSELSGARSLLMPWSELGTLVR
jgi:hypothetical protein